MDICLNLLISCCRMEMLIMPCKMLRILRLLYSKSVSLSSLFQWLSLVGKGILEVELGRFLRGNHLYRGDFHSIYFFLQLRSFSRYPRSLFQAPSGQRWGDVYEAATRKGERESGCLGDCGHISPISHPHPRFAQFTLFIFYHLIL